MAYTVQEVSNFVTGRSYMQTRHITHTHIHTIQAW